MKILMVRANQGTPDSRVEKELFSLSKENEIELLGWNRTKSGETETTKKSIFGKEIVFHLIDVPAPQGEGFKKMIFPMIKFWGKEIKFIRKNGNKYDAIHFCDFDTAFPLFFFRTKKKYIIYDIFDYYADSHVAPKPIGQLIKKIENRIIEKANCVILCSESRLEQIQPAKPNKVVIIHNSPMNIKVNSKAKDDNSSNGKKRLVYIGVLSEGRYLKEIANVIQSRSDLIWTIAGFGALDEFFADLSKKSPNIVYLGKVDYEKALEIQNDSDVMTAIYDPSVANHKYAAPNKFYEALFLGKPLIAIKDTGMDSYFKAYKLGELIDISDKSFEIEFDLALDRLLAYKSEWSNIAIDEKNIYQKYFSWDEMEERLLEIYR